MSRSHDARAPTHKNPKYTRAKDLLGQALEELYNAIEHEEVKQ